MFCPQNSFQWLEKHLYYSPSVISTCESCEKKRKVFTNFIILLFTRFLIYFLLFYRYINFNRIHCWKILSNRFTKMVEITSSKKKWKKLWFVEILESNFEKVWVIIVTQLIISSWVNVSVHRRCISTAMIYCHLIAQLRMIYGHLPITV